MTHDVLVIGGGIGGLTAAIVLRARSHAVTVIARDPDWSVYDLGITQQANVARGGGARHSRRLSLRRLRFRGGRNLRARRDKDRACSRATAGGGLPGQRRHRPARAAQGVGRPNDRYGGGDSAGHHPLADEVDDHVDPEAAFAACRARRFERCAYIVNASFAIGAGQIGKRPPVDNHRTTAEMFAVTSQPI